MWGAMRVWQGSRELRLQLRLWRSPLSELCSLSLLFAPKPRLPALRARPAPLNKSLTSHSYSPTAAAGFAFAAVDHTVANMIESSDNGIAGASGGCAAGFVSGIRSGSIPKAVGMCAFMGSMVGTYDLAGGQLGWESGKKPRSEREKERESFFKKKAVAEE